MRPDGKLDGELVENRMHCWLRRRPSSNLPLGNLSNRFDRDERIERLASLLRGYKRFKCGRSDSATNHNLRYESQRQRRIGHFERDQFGKR